MRFLSAIFFFIISSYFYATSFLADKLVDFFSLSTTSNHLVFLDNFSEKVKNTSIPELPTDFSSSIPNLLRNNVDYLKATAVEATENHTVNDPILALVNIYCTFVTKTTIRTTTGSGFFIHSNGVILTNAHVAQYLLLSETDYLGDAECLVRTGDPAKPEYKAELLYISPAWIAKNTTSINDPHPVGTGERDYALLLVTESVTGKPLPEKFPALKIFTDPLPVTSKDSGVVVSGYPAFNSNPENFANLIYPLFATSSITNLYTFGSNYADVISLLGSKVGHGGASGGPVTDEKKEVVAMITTKGDDLIDGEGSLRAITISHINRTIEEETGMSLERNMRGNLRERTKIFSKILTPFMISILNSRTDNLENS